MARNASGHGISEVQLYNSTVTTAAGSVVTSSAGAPAGTPVVDSVAGAAAAIAATLAGAAGVTTYICGFTVTGAGATAASVIEVTITGLATILRYKVVVPAGATTSITPLDFAFSRPVPASAPNTAIVVNVPSFGAGNTAAAVVAVGFRA